MGLKVVARLKDDEGWDRPTGHIDALNNCYPLLVALLYVFGRPERSEAVTIAPVDITPIMNPASSKLYVSSSRIPYLTFMTSTRWNQSPMTTGSSQRARW